MKIVNLRESLDHEGTFANGMLVVTSDHADAPIAFKNYNSVYVNGKNKDNFRAVRVLVVGPVTDADEYTFIIRVKNYISNKDHAAVKGHGNHRRIYDELMNIYRYWEKHKGFPDGSVVIKSLEPLVKK